MEYHKLFSKSEAISLLEMIHGASSCSTEEEFRALMIRLRSLVAFEYSFCGINGKIERIEAEMAARRDQKQVAQEWQNAAEVAMVRTYTLNGGDHAIDRRSLPTKNGG